MSEKIIHTHIPACWLDTLNEEVKPLLKRTEFFIDDDYIHNRVYQYVSVRFQIDESDGKSDFLFRLAGRDLESTYEDALKRFVEDRIGHRI